MERVLGLARQQGERATAFTLADKCEFGQGEQLQQVGAGGAEADLDHPVGHRDDFVDCADGVLERVEAGGTALAIEYPRDFAGVDPAPAWPVARLQTEDVAEPIIADVPAFGEASVDLTASIEPDETLRDIAEQRLVGRSRSARRRIDQPRASADYQHFTRPDLGLVARPRRERDEHHQREAEERWHRVVLGSLRAGWKVR